VLPICHACFDGMPAEAVNHYVCAKMDNERFCIQAGLSGRSLPGLLASLAELRDLGIAFVSLTEALDFAAPAGRAMIGLLPVFAEFERDMIRERVKSGTAHAKSDSSAVSKIIIPPFSTLSYKRQCSSTSG